MTIAWKSAIAQKTRVSGSVWTDWTTISITNAGGWSTSIVEALGGELLVEEIGHDQVLADDQGQQRQDRGEQDENDRAVPPRPEHHACPTRKPTAIATRPTW